MGLLSNTRSITRQMAVDEATSKSGDPQRAIALAILYLADVLAKR